MDILQEGDGFFVHVSDWNEESFPARGSAVFFVQIVFQDENPNHFPPFRGNFEILNWFPNAERLGSLLNHRK